MNSLIKIQFANNIPAWTIAFAPISGDQIKDSRSICFLEIKDVSPGIEPLLKDFQDKFSRCQSLEHWSIQGGTTYFDNVIYVLDKILSAYGLSYEVSDRPPPGKMENPGGFFVGMMK